MENMKRNVILWGCGYGGEYDYYLLKDKLNIIAFADSDKSKAGTVFAGKQVLSPEAVIEQYPDVAIINTIKKFSRPEVEKSLRSQGITNEILYSEEILSSDIVETRRKECAAYHITCMNSYFDRAEEKESLDTFWAEHSPFRKMFDKMDISSVIELACGRGRHVPYYADKSGKIILVDILDKNIALCKERFNGIDKIQYYVNSGCDLKNIADETATAIFSYDAMVHFESIDVYQYLLETYRVLQRGGMALYHHSNNKDYKATFLSAEGGRNYMTMDLFAHFADRAKLDVVEQKEYQWGKNVYDGITLLQKR